MDQILAFFASIGEAISAVFRFLQSLVEDLVYFVRMLAGLEGSVSEYFPWLPASILTLALLLISIVVILRIIGRD